MINPSEFIKLIRESFGGSLIVYTEGSCYKFYEILKGIYPEAEAWYEPIEGHVITKIDNRFYDIHGQIVRSDKAYPLSQEKGIEKQLMKCKYTIKL